LLIAAQTSAAAQAAVRSLQGAFSKIIHALVEELIRLRQYVEAAIDFPEEEIDFFTEAKVGEQLFLLQERLTLLLKQASQGVMLADGVPTVIVGRANVGKSSILNLLAAIVTEIPGTTRDLLKASILLDGITLDLIDTAGLRTTTDIIEQEGIRRAWGALEQAQLVVLVVDALVEQQEPSQALIAELRQKIAPAAKIVIAYNKIDLVGKNAAIIEQAGVAAGVLLSAKTGEGLELLKEALKRAIGAESIDEHVFIARRRHLVALEGALVCVVNGAWCLQEQAGGELLAEELRLAQQWLGEITGEFSADDLLGRIFSEFCLGK